MRLEQFYRKAKECCIRQGYQKEIDLVENRYFADQTSEDFFREYVFVVCNAGMKNQIATRIFNDYMNYGIDEIRHKQKRKAIERAELHYSRWFRQLQLSSDRLGYLETLPFIGPITKYHLARNLGIDVAKPDRHLVKIAEIFGYPDVQTMCDEVSKNTGDRIGTVDVVLWRAMNLNNGNLEELVNELSKIFFEDLLATISLHLF